MEVEVTHKEIYEKLVEHEGKIVAITKDVHGIKVELEPISAGVKSMAFSFKGLLYLGAGCAAVVGILELWEQLQ